MLSSKYIGNLKNNEHSKLLQRIIRDDLFGKLDITEINLKLNPKHYWSELFFTQKGILTNPKQLDFYEIIAQPDIVCLSNNPDYLIFTEVKLSNKPESIEETKLQLQNYHNYVLNNPEFLISFLEKEGINDNLIDHLSLGFLGVSKTRHGIKETYYFDF